MNNKDIVKVAHIKNVRIRNTNNGALFPMQNILKIYFRNGESRTIDLFSERDITDIEYLQEIATPKTKEKVIFKEIEI